MPKGNPMTRQPAVAGQFYPGDEKGLKRELERYIVRVEKKESALAALAPHAAYMYSGGVAGAVYSRMEIPDIIVIMCPNHSGLGARAAIMLNGTWEIPGTSIPIHTQLAEDILKNSKELEEDSLAHLREHSLEVHLPFLFYLNPHISFVPICLMGRNYSFCEDIGKAVASAIKERKEKALIVASSDMTHYESHDEAKKKDKKAIDRVLALDPEGLLDTVRKQGITMCGVIPATAMLVAAKELGARRAELVKYATSGEVSGDYDQVVGYAGILVS